jgi:hypothetical protein
VARQAPTTLGMLGADQDMFLAGHPAPREGLQDWPDALTPDPLRAAGSVAGLPDWFDPRRVSAAGWRARRVSIPPATAGQAVAIAGLLRAQCESCPAARGPMAIAYISE